MGERVFKMGVRDGLCGESGVCCRSESVMVGVVKAWSDEGAIVVGKVGRWTNGLGSWLIILCMLHDHAGRIYVLSSHVTWVGCLSGTAGHV